MKTRELIMILEQNGYVLQRANKHYFYKKGTIVTCVPRHKEVNIFLAKKILKQAQIAV